MRCARLARYTLRRAHIVAALLGRLATLPEAVVRNLATCLDAGDEGVGSLAPCKPLSLATCLCAQRFGALHYESFSFPPLPPRQQCVASQSCHMHARVVQKVRAVQTAECSTIVCVDCTAAC